MIKKILIKLIQSILWIIDSDHRNINKISDDNTKKFTHTIIQDFESDFGHVSKLYRTVPYEVWETKTQTKTLYSADKHRVIKSDHSCVWVEELKVGDLLKTDNGIEKVISNRSLGIKTHMYCLEVNTDDPNDINNHLHYTNGILSHNTETVRIFMIHYMLFNEYKTIGIFSNKEDTSIEILSKIKTAYQSIPIWLQVGVAEWAKSAVVLENGSRIIANSTSSDSGRGFTYQLLLVDEAAYIENWDDFFGSIGPTITAGTKTKLILVSTPNGLNYFYNIWKQSEEGKNEYKRILAIWSDVPGRDEAWKQTTLKMLNNDHEKFAQDYECKFEGSSGTLIAGWKLRLLKPITPIKKSLGLSIYVDPEINHSYALIVDVSAGKGQDYSAFSIIDITNMPYNQVCTYRNNMTTPIDYAEIVYRMGKSYNNAILLCELNNTMGGQVTQSLHYDFEYDNILFTESAGKLGKRITSKGGKGVDIGVMTTQKVRLTGCSILKLLIESDQLIINDNDTIEELSTFSRDGKTYNAEEGKHDDLVIGLVLFAWLSDQQYFRDISDINTLDTLRDKTDEELFNDVILFGYIIDQPDILIENINSGRNLMNYGKSYLDFSDELIL